MPVENSPLRRMMIFMRSRALAGAGLAALLLVVGAAAQSQGFPQAGQAAPGLKLPALDGRPLDLAALRGKVVIVNFWATWCTPCRAEMPALDTYYRLHKAQGLEVLGISIDDMEDRAEVGKVMQSFSYPAGLMRQAQENGFGAPVAVPFTYVIDGAGVIRSRIAPTREGLTRKQLDAMVGPLLAHGR